MASTYHSSLIAKLDDFLRLSDREILTSAGKITHKAAVTHANAEFDKFKALQATQPTTVEKDFEQSLKQMEKIETTAKKKKKGGGDD